tara:strand:+ start:5590 stop:6693 length:1104 start_codon:yes stop_codon:yes gene_type:complete
MSDETFIHQKMISYIGNKRKLIPEIEGIIQEVCTLLNKKKLNLFDAFAGSSVVSRLFTKYANNLYSNDMEPYSSIMNSCFLIQPNEDQKRIVEYHIETMNELSEKGPYKEGIICKYYAPKETENIQEGERCFYTRENALIIDTLRDYIQTFVTSDLFNYCISPLLIQASIHVNTSGQFKGFYKNKETGIGQWGGTAENDLKRIKGKIKLEMPVWSKRNYSPQIFQEDINILIYNIPNTFDLIYLDPPYNIHGYSNNYYMFNIIIENKEPKQISEISGIPVDWTRSMYNYKKTAQESMKELLEQSLKKSKYVLLSYNNEGIIQADDWDVLLQDYKVKKYEIQYDTYKGSRNLKERENKVTEILYLINI